MKPIPRNLKPFAIAGLLAATLFAAGCMYEERPPVREVAPSEFDAEVILLDYAKKQHLADESHPGEYFCGVAIRKGEYIVVDLRRTDKTLPKDGYDTSLVGYYAVRKEDGALFEWDVTEDAPRKLLKPGVPAPAAK